MIGSLRGRIIDRSAKGDVIVEVGGVGYRVLVTASTLARVDRDDTFLHVHTHVREDALVLYGFSTRDERATFEILIGAHGVGPALAMGILASHSPDSLRTAVATDDVDALTTVPGVGKKTAARLLIELKSKLANDTGDYDGALAALNDGVASIPASERDPRDDVRAALAGLGYANDEIRGVVRHLPADGDPGALLRQALSLLAGGE